jgi:ribose transport system substrate-binding protein
MKRRVFIAATLATVSLIATAAAGAKTGSAYRVVYIPGLTGNPFYSTVACGAESVAKSLNVDFSVQGAPTFAVTAQTPIVEAVTASHPNAIMISNDDPKAMIAPLLAAQKAGIKIVNIDGDLADMSVGVTNIQSDNTLGGQLAGQALGKLIHGKGTVVIIDNSPGYPISEERRDGFLDAMKKFPGITVLPVQYSNNSPSTAASIVTSTAAAHSDFAGVYTVETNNTEARSRESATHTSSER